MAMMPPRPLRTASEEIPSLVLRAALALMTEEGPEGLTVRALARRAGVAPMSIYNHFGGKDGVLDAIMVDGFALLATWADVTFDDARTTLVAGSMAYRDFALAHRSHYTVMFLHQFVGYVPAAETMYVAAKGFEILTGQVRRCTDVGVFPGRSYVDVAQQLWAAVHGYVALEILGINFASDRDRVFRDFVEAVITGLDAPLDDAT